MRTFGRRLNEEGDLEDKLDELLKESMIARSCDSARKLVRVCELLGVSTEDVVQLDVDSVRRFGPDDDYPIWEREADAEYP